MRLITPGWNLIGPDRHERGNSGNRNRWGAGVYASPAIFGDQDDRDLADVLDWHFTRQLDRNRDIGTERLARDADRAIGRREQVRLKCRPVSRIVLLVFDRLGRKIMRTPELLMQKPRPERASKHPERREGDQ